MKFPSGGGVGNLIAQAQKMQTEMKAMQEKLAVREVLCESAGGRIKIKINGKQEILNMEISQEIIDPNDAEMLSDLIKVAVNDAVSQSQKMVASEMSRIVPPGMAGMF
jgi:DNA-binding YbaB/EbfC family protein